MDTYGEEKERSRKEKLVLLKDGGEAKSSEHMEDLYASVRSWGT